MITPLLVIGVVSAVMGFAGLWLWRAATPPGGHRRVRSDGWLGFITNLLGDNRDGETLRDEDQRAAAPRE